MARIIPLISTAWAWWGIIACANIASAALWSPALAGADCAGALEEPIFPWSIPGMDVPDEPGVPVLHPASARKDKGNSGEGQKLFGFHRTVLQAGTRERQRAHGKAGYMNAGPEGPGAAEGAAQDRVAPVWAGRRPVPMFC